MYSLTACRSFSRRPASISSICALWVSTSRCASATCRSCARRASVTCLRRCGFAVTVIGLGLAEFPRGFLAGSLVTLLAAEDLLEHSRWFGFEVGPLRSRDGNCKLA